MAALSDKIKGLFPVNKIEDVIEIFKTQMEGDAVPNLALLSILVGYIENQLTNPKNLPPAGTEANLQGLSNYDQNDITDFPIVTLSAVESLYKKFVSQIRGSLEMKKNADSIYANREIVKKVSDVIWSSLTSSYYKDKAHLQSLFSYLTGRKLDCFGVAFAVVASCQVLGFKGVHLVLSEDHAWVNFGENGSKTAEVTWHGKGNEDKRGEPISSAKSEKSWLYLNGYPVCCSRYTEVAAIVSGINPSINATTDSMELSSLQQKLLWLLYDYGHLKSYPMALGSLGDLEELSPSPGRPPPLELYNEAISSAKLNYNNQHVYPYTYLGGFFYRCGCYKDSLIAWAKAAAVIRNFNYSRDDEEIYKEFLEIANDLIPQIIRVVSINGTEPSGRSQIPLLQDPECFAALLQFYDGLCAWEEDSSTPVLHIGWAKPLVSTISKFNPLVRALVEIKIPDNENETNTEDEVVSNSNLTQNGNAVVLSSHKMAGLKELLRSEKLNTSAIQLQLTAQSQVHMVKRVRQQNENEIRKRSRRD